MVTIKDIARKAGVAPSTVSRVIQDHKGISIRTKEKIRLIMDEMDYRPNVSARNLVLNSSHTIAMILKSEAHDAYENPFNNAVYNGVVEACREDGYSIISTTKNTEREILEEVKSLIRLRQVDGFIVMFSKTGNKVTEYLSSVGSPFVVVGKDINQNSDAIYIDNDNVTAAYQLTQLMIDKGIRDIRVINDDEGFTVAKDRMKGFKDALRDNALDSDECIIQVGSELESIRDTLKEAITKKQPEGIITFDGYLHAKVLAALYELNIRVPDDMLTATFNESPLTQFASPPQTTVDIHTADIGREAGRALIGLIQEPNKLKCNITLPTQVIERQSTRKE